MKRELCRKRNSVFETKVYSNRKGKGITLGEVFGERTLGIDIFLPLEIRIRTENPVSIIQIAD